jgi:hypothetical protein
VFRIPPRRAAEALAASLSTSAALQGQITFGNRSFEVVIATFSSQKPLHAKTKLKLVQFAPTELHHRFSRGNSRLQNRAHSSHRISS